MQPPCHPEALAARRLGLYGGSFDPPHLGHLHCARRAREAFDLDHVVLIPAACSPHKEGRELASGSDRQAMLELLFADEPWSSVWTGELERAGLSYSLETARAFRSAMDEGHELFWILGSDNLPGLSTWRGAEEFVRTAHPIVVHRRGDELDEGVLAGWSPEARELLVAGYLAGEPFDACASDLRRDLSDADEALFPAALWEYVRSRGIYRCEP